MTKKLMTLALFSAMLLSLQAQKSNLKPTFEPMVWSDVEVLSVNKMAPHVNVIGYMDENGIEKLDYQRSPFRVSLNGQWKLKVESDATASALQVDAKSFDASAWASCKVPSQLTFNGKPVTNPEITSPTSLPSQGNVVATYYREFDVSRLWLDYVAYLQLHAGAACYVWVNRQFVGYAEDSRALHEFDITPFLRYGKPNNVIVKTVSASSGSLLEMAGQSDKGLWGDACIVLKPLTHIRDYSLTTSYNEGTNIGSLRLAVSLNNKLKRGRYYVEAEVWSPQGKQIEKMGKWVVFDKRSEVDAQISREFDRVQPWNEATPTLYTLVLRVRDDHMDEVETTGCRFGFRSIDRTDGQLRLNGVPITLKGVVYDCRLGEGKKDAIEALRKQLTDIKLKNINAIRTMGYAPTDELLYELCDEMGLYVVCDANIYPFSSKNKAIAADEEYAALFEDRVSSMYESVKNHTSIIAWSLGNSEDNGLCMESAYKRLKQLDKQRPVLYEGAQYSENTDLIAVKNQTVDQLKQYLAKNHAKSLVMMKYGDSKGNGLGGLEPVWSMARKYNKIQGGFLNSWYWLSEESYAPQSDEVRHLYRNFEARLVKTTPDAAEFEITNYSDFLNPSLYKIDYIIYTSLKPMIVEGEVVTLPKPKQSERVTFKIPTLSLYADEHLYVRFVAKMRKPSAGMGKHQVIDAMQLELPMKKADRQPIPAYMCQPLVVSETSSSDAHTILSIQGGQASFLFDLDRGELLHYSFASNKLIDGPIALNTWRVPTASDKIDKNAKTWNRFAPGKLTKEVVAAEYHQVDDNSVMIDVMNRYLNGEGVSLLDENQTYLVLSSGDVLLATEVTVTEQVYSLARVGVRIPIMRSLENAEWYGLCGDTYSDRRGCSLFGSYKASAESLCRQYEEPQEVGNHSLTSWVSYHNGKVGLFVDMLDTLFNFKIAQSRSGYAADFDYKMSGIGSATAGVDISESDLLTARKYRFVTHIRGYNCDENDARDLARISFPTISSNVLPMPTITSDLTRFNGPMNITLSSTVAGAEIRYTLDGTTPNEKSLLYKVPFHIESSTVVKARTMKKGYTSSFAATQYFTYDYVSGAEFSLKPNTPYNKDYQTALFDGEMGDVNDLSQGWIGFSGNDMMVVLTLGKEVSLSDIQLRFAHNPDSWVMAPESVEVYLSLDGSSFDEGHAAVVTYDPNSESMNSAQVIEHKVNLDGSSAKYIKVIAKNAGRLPQWHKAKGLKSWILTDEIKLRESIR